MWTFAEQGLTAGARTNAVCGWRRPSVSRSRVETVAIPDPDPLVKCTGWCQCCLVHSFPQPIAVAYLDTEVNMLSFDAA